MTVHPLTVEFSLRSQQEFARAAVVPRLRKATHVVLDNEQVAAAEISLVLVDSTEMRTLNNRHLQHDYDTDVLSFLLDETVSADQSGPGNSRRGTGKIIDGEVIVCAEMAARTAARFGWSPTDELVLYLVHGLLHLVGYDDLTETERVIMRSRERSILKQLNLTPRYSESCDEQEDPDQPPGPSTGNSTPRPCDSKSRHARPMSVPARPTSLPPAAPACKSASTTPAPTSAPAPTDGSPPPDSRETGS